jgi:antitoxin (DNA-binding transcriptional repressor) of toxin-antitoxin stability system
VDDTLNIQHSFQISGYDRSMAVIHISEADAVRDFAALMARVREGAEVVIESDERAIAVMRPATVGPGRLLSDSIATAEARGSTATLDEDFAHDLEEAMNSHREPLDPPAWD